MKNIISNINSEIERKRDQLKNIVSHSFSEIVIVEKSQPVTSTQIARTQTPPISYMLYGTGGLSAIGALSMMGSEGSDDSQSRIGLLCALSAISIFGGFFFSRKSGNKSTTVRPSVNNFNQTENKVKEKVGEIVKKTSQDFDDFLEQEKNQLQKAINDTQCNDSIKNQMRSKIAIHEILDIKTIDFMKLANASQNATQLQDAVDIYKRKMLQAIDDACKKQMSTYLSLLDLQ